MKGWKKSGDVINRQRVDIGYEIYESLERKKKCGINDFGS